MTLCPSLLLAASHSGTGKTLVAVALIAALQRRGLRLRAAKLGPDYLDTQFLAAAAQNPAVNFDMWAMRRDSLEAVITQAHTAADALVIESAMGLYDGAADSENSGSAWHFAKQFSIPILLVLSAKGYGGASLAAMIRGFVPKNHPCKLLLNNVASPRHERSLRTTFRETLPHIELIGCLPRLSWRLPSRHLGLVQPSELPDLQALIARAADWLEHSIDLTRLRAFMRPLTGLSQGGSTASLLPPPGQKLAIARDEAFRFLYEAQLQAWRQAGAELTFFSPLADESPPPQADWIFLPGGYPELHAARLSANLRFLEGLRRSPAQIYGECGGYMCLGQRLIDKHKLSHPMAGLLPLSTTCETDLNRIFYANARTEEKIFGAKTFRGHVFHCARIEGGEGRLFTLSDAAGQQCGYTGARVGKVCGSFLHIIDSAATKSC